MRIRLADPAADAIRLAKIYRPVVEETATSFEEQAPDAAEMERRVRATLPTHPWLVAVEGDEERVVGYAYAGPVRSRPAYRWSVEVSVYVEAGARRRGVGRRLCGALLGVLETQGFCRAYAGITLPNPPSVALHEALGFRPVGTYRRVGFKHGAWHDVGWWQRSLAEADEPAEPRSVAEAASTSTWRRTLDTGDVRSLSPRD